MSNPKEEDLLKNEIVSRASECKDGLQEKQLVGFVFLIKLVQGE